MSKVTLTWKASTDTVDGYNVYRGSKAGQETTLLTPTPITALTFTDTNPVAGQDFYDVKAVLGGVESIPSNEASVVLLPAPPTNLVAVAS